LGALEITGGPVCMQRARAARAARVFHWSAPGKAIGCTASLGIAAVTKFAIVMCLALSFAGAAQASPWKHYSDTGLGYTIAYPANWSIDTHYVYDQLGPGKEIKGVAFQIPAGLAAGTNLGEDTRLSVESLPGTACTPGQFVDPAESVHTLRADHRVYTAASSGDAGAGNRYETQVFVVAGTSPCLAVRYFVHSSAIENFDPGTVRPFDRAKLMRAFDDIRATLTFGK
jgi:hypothetical protein